VIVLLPEYHHQLAFDVAGALEAVVILARAQGMAVDVGREVAYRGCDARVESAAVGEVAAEAHARGADAAVAGWEGEKEGDGGGGVGVVGGEFLALGEVLAVVGRSRSLNTIHC